MILEKLMQLHQTACRVFLMDTALSRGFTSGRLMRIGLQLLIYLVFIIIKRLFVFICRDCSVVWGEMAVEKPISCYRESAYTD